MKSATTSYSFGVSKEDNGLVILTSRERYLKRAIPHCASVHVDTWQVRGFPTLRHNEVRDITAGLIKQVAHQVTIKPHLQPLSGEHLRYSTANTEDQARLDVAASGIWGG